MLKEIGDLAGQRELVAENLQGQVTQSISLLSKTLRDDRKKCLTDGAMLSQNLSTQISSLERSKRLYEKAFREAEKAVDSFQKADADLNLSRADVSSPVVALGIVKANAGHEYCIPREAIICGPQTVLD